MSIFFSLEVFKFLFLLVDKKYLFEKNINFFNSSFLFFDKFSFEFSSEISKFFDKFLTQF
jgi:hypothetical protein